MKNIIKILSVFAFVTLFAACSDAYELNYVSTVKISFEGVEDGIVTLDKGVDSYTAKISVKASTGITYFEIYNANPRTGDKVEAISGTAKSFETPEIDYSQEYTITGLTGNKCIKVSVTDVDGKLTEKSLLIKVTPSVIFSEELIMETADDYYGSYYATWLTGRVYLRSNAGEYAKEVDLSLGMIAVNGELVPALVSPAKRSESSLPTMSGLKDAQFSLTNLSINEYKAITNVDSTPISSLSDPTLSTVEIANNKVYLYKTSDGKKGLFAITKMAKRTGTIENADGKWEKEYTYWRVTFSTKTIAE